MTGPSSVEELLMASRARVWCASGEARTIRERARVTVAEIASAIGGNANTISKWESGHAAPSTPSVVAYGRVLAALRSELGEAS